jgi:hypothetical protein
MKPESIIEGNRINILICIAWSWLPAIVDNTRPSARLAPIKASVVAASAHSEPPSGTAKSR